MSTRFAEPIAKEIDLPVLDRDFIDESLERVTGAQLIYGNDVRLLIDATENYPAWLEAIDSAEKRIFFETYIIHDDEQGALFGEKLIEKAKQGVEVKLIYDWFGGLGNTPWRYWRGLRQHGIEVRAYNPPKLTDPLGIFSRDHRKSMVVDGRLAFISGLCVGQDWVGHPKQGTPPWRDTGVQLTGPAVADVTVWDGTRVQAAPTFQWGSRVANAPPSNNNPFDPGTLVGAPNRERDVEQGHNNFDRQLRHPGISSGKMTENDVIGRLFAADAAYGDDQDYDYFPQADEDGFNSNGYARGVLEAAGYRDVPQPPNTPGFEKPVSREEFRSSQPGPGQCTGTHICR